MSGSIKRLYSFGFLFGARDQGAVQTTENLAEGMDSLRDSVQEVAASSGRIQRFGNALSAITVGQLARVNSTLSDLAGRAGALGASADDTQMESFGAQFGQTFRQATAGLGQYRGEVDRLRGQISGTAFNLQVDAGDILGAVTRIAQTGRSLEDYGLSVRDLGGSIQASILTGEQLGGVLTSLSEGYDLGADGATRMMDTVTALGERTGAGADAMRAMPNMISAADDVISSFPAGAAPAIDTVIESITRLASATHDRLGGDFAESMTQAIGVFTELGGQRREMRNLLTGISSDFPAMATEIGIASGDIDGALSSVMSDPLTFASNMQEMMAGMDPTSTSAHRLTALLERMPENFRFLVQGGDEAAAALRRAQVPIEGVEGAFSRMARGASGSTRTFGEAMSLLEDGFQTSLNRMTTSTNREVLGRQRAAYERMGNYLEGWRSDSGPLGLITQGFLDFRRHGVIGLTSTIRERLGPTFPWLADRMETFLPVLGDVGGGLFEMVGQMGPMLLVMSQMGGAIPGLGSAVGMLLNPWTLLIAGVAAMIYYWDDLGPLIEQGAGYLEDFAGVASNWVNSVDWEGMGNTIAMKLTELFASFGEGGRGREVMRTMAGALRSLLAGAGTALMGISTGLFGDTGGGILNSIFSFLWDSTNIGNLTRAIEDGDWADIIFEGLFTAMGPLYNMVRTGLSSMLGFDVVGEFWDTVLRPTFSDLVDFWNSEIQPVVDETIVLFEDLAAVAVDFWEEDLKPVLLDLKKQWMKVWIKTLKPETIRFFRAVGEGMRDTWRNYIRPALVLLGRVWMATFQNNMRASIMVFGAVVEAGVRTFSGIQTAIGRLGRAWTRWRDILANGWALIGTAVRNSVGIALEYAHHNFTELVNGWETGLLRIKQGFLSLPVLVLNAFRTLVQNNPLTSLFESLGIDLGVASSALNEMERSLTGQGSALFAVNQQLRDAETATQTRAREHTARMANMRDEIAAQANTVRDSYRQWDAADEQYTSAQRGRMEERVAGVQRFTQRALEISERFNQRLNQFVEGVASGDFSGDARGRRQVESAVDAARPMMAELERAAGSGRITAAQYEQAATALTSAVEGGESAVGDASARIRASLLAEIESTGEREPSEAGGRRRRGRRARVRAEPAGGGESPGQRDSSRRRTREEASRSAREAQAEMTIAAFGPQAVRQLREALGGRRGSGAPRPRPRTGGPEGAGDVH